jgi:hypothetical protein
VVAPFALVLAACGAGTVPTGPAEQSPNELGEDDKFFIRPASDSGAFQMQGGRSARM